MRQRSRHAAGLAPLADVAERIAQAAQHQADFAHVALRGALAQVGIQGFTDTGFPLADGFLQQLQRADAELHIAGDMGQEELALCLDYFVHISRLR